MAKQLEVTEAGVTCNIPANQENFNTGIWLEAGLRYGFSATGTWTDLNIETGPDGFERWYMSPFKIFRRQTTLSWFALIGMASNPAVAT